MRANKIILIDDNQAILNVYGKLLEREGYNVYTAQNGEEGLELLKNMDVDLVITDMYMPIMGGMTFVENVKRIYPYLYIMVITGEGSIENAVNAMKKGVYSYLQKPLNIDEFIIEVRKIIDIVSQSRQNEYMKEMIDAQYDTFIGESKNVNHMKSKLPIVANTNSTVLITGESGTGKELIAQAIHNLSNRKDNPMIKVNCAALSPTLLESELFGHEKGAFTGAINQKKGRFEIADNGTLFLDEIGEMTIEMQTKLLRIIQEKTFERVGGQTTLESNFRLICATNRDLEKDITEGNFREDLYYRLNVIPINLPSLKERKSDIQLLIKYFAEKFASEMGKTAISVSSEMLKMLTNYNWPGNVRELKNIIERLTVFSINGEIDINELPLKILENDHFNIELNETLSEARDTFEKIFIQKCLVNNDWQITSTSNALGITRKNLYEKIKKHGLRKPDSVCSFLETV